MRHLLRILFLFLIPLIPLQAAPSLSLGLPKEEILPPNPLDLSSNWWDYYNVDSKTLQDRKKVTADLFEKIQNELSYSRRTKLQPAFDRILIQLQTLIDLKSRTVAPAVPKQLTKKSISFEEWIGSIKQLLEQERELEFLQIQLDLTKSSFRSGAKYVDTRFAAYLKAGGEESNRLDDGLRIMQGRISLAIEKIQISNLNVLIEHKKKQLSNLTENMHLLFTKIDFSKIASESYQSQLQVMQTEENRAYSAFFQAYEATSSLSDQNSITNQKMIETRIKYEIAKMETMHFEMLKMLVQIEKRSQHLNRKMIQQQIDRWKEDIQNLYGEIPNWEASSEALLEQSLSRLRSKNSSSYEAAPSKELAESSILNIQILRDELFINEYLLSTVAMARSRAAFGLLDTFSIWWDASIAFLKKQAGWFNQSLFKIGEVPVTPWGLIKMIVIIVGFYFAGKLASKWIIYFGSKQKRIAKTSVYVFSRLSYYLLFCLGIVISGGVLGLDLTFLAYIAGALALWVGFSLQSIFYNFISGIIVLLTKMIRINDYIELESGERGFVSAINLRTTIVETFHGSELIVPNSEFVGKKFTNHSLYLYVKRVHIPFRVSLDEDREHVAKVVKEAAKTVSITSDSKEPELWIMGYGENYVKMELVVWINSYLTGDLAARDPQYYWALDKALRENNIKIPIPQTIVQMAEPTKMGPSTS